MINPDNFFGQAHLLGEELGLNLVPEISAEATSLNITSNRGVFSNLFEEDGELSVIEKALAKLREQETENQSLLSSFNSFNSIPNYGGSGADYLSGNKESIPTDNTAVELSNFHPQDFAVVAEGQVIINSKSDFDGEESDPTDDALIYSEDGFKINSKAVLPIQLDTNGNPVTDSEGRFVLVDNSIAVGEDYDVARADAIDHKYSNLLPPQIVDNQSVTLPDYSTLLETELTTRLPDDTPAIELNPRDTKINNSKKWQENFPAPGTKDNPTFVRVKGGKLNIPPKVDLSNYVIIVEQGNITFTGKDHDLDNVLLVAESGSIKLGKVNASNSSFLAASDIKLNQKVEFTGDNLLANESGNIVFNNKTETIGAESKLTVIASEKLTINGKTEARGEFLAGYDLKVNQKSTLIGSLKAKGDIIFNGKTTVIGEPEYALTIDSVTVSESGTTASLTVSLSSPSNNPVTVDFASIDGTATAELDYQAVSGTLTFNPGETSQTIDVEIIGDNVEELDESFAIELSNNSSGIIRDNQGIVNILDDDNPPEISINSVTTVETDTNNTEITFTVSLSAPSSLPITAEYTTADGTAIAGADYEATNSLLTFAPGETSKTVTVTVNGDSLDEIDETFTLNLTNPTNATIAEAVGTGTIVDNDIPPLDLSAGLVNDTGIDSSDSITSDPTITGVIAHSQGTITLQANLGGMGNQLIDISDSLQNDGSFSLDLNLLQTIYGDSFDNGTYTLSLIATDTTTGQFSTTEITFTFDNTAPIINLVTPLPEGDHSNTARLIGEISEASTVTYSIDGGVTNNLTVDDGGNFDQALGDLSLGNHTVVIAATDSAGNVTSNQIAFQVGDSFTIPNATTGWGAKNSDTILLGEQDSYVVESSRTIELGLATGEDGTEQGTRTVSFDLELDWDKTDTEGLEDRLLVYLVDPNNTSETLLDNGAPGTAVFSLAGEAADFIPGLVSFDGKTVTIDVTSLKGVSEGLLVFQLLNQDSDIKSIIRVDNFNNSTDLEGTENPLFPNTDNVVPPAGELDLSLLNNTNTVTPVIKKVGFNSTTGQYQAQLKVTNTGSAIGRNLAVVFDNLPAGVELANASGTDANGNPYLNLRNTIPTGGLAKGGTSDAVVLNFNNPNLERLELNPRVLVGGVNQAPSFAPLDNLTVLPGQTLTIPLLATDPDGDNITFRIQSEADLPTGMLQGGGKLVFTPTPDEVGSYQFTVIASDGVEEVAQTVTLEVLADPVTTTRISGTLIDIDGTPLSSVLIELGRITTFTDEEGNFTLELPPELVPTEEFNIEIPTGDIYFDPYRTGNQTIDFQRAQFQDTSGTDSLNPRRHPNLVSTFLDGSGIYGSDTDRADALRLNDGTGKLKTSQGDLLPFNSIEYFPEGLLENGNAGRGNPGSLFVAGDVRASENVALASFHTLFVREHNRLAETIATENPDFDEETIYQQARKLVTAQIQQITYSEYLPLLLGENTIPTYTGYQETVDPAISAFFATAAFRIGHSQSVAEVQRLDESGNELAGGHLSLREAFFNTQPVIQDGIDPILRGLSNQLAQEVDAKVIDELRNFLFGPPGSGGMDLVSIGIQRGRDLGLPSYTQARIDYGLTPVTSFDQITSDVEVQQALEQVYGTVDKIDPWVGGLAEDHAQGAIIGELFQAVIADQFTRLRDGNRFWYENEQLTESELNLVRSTTLSSLIQRNTGITGLQDNVFTLSTAPNAPTAAGTVAANSSTEIPSYDGTGNNPSNPQLGAVGENLGVDFSLSYGDGISTPAGADRPNVRDISNGIFAQTGDLPNSYGATALSLFWGQFLAHYISHTPTGITNTLKIHADGLTGDKTYPFIAEKLPLVLGHNVYQGVNNVITRPIYLPALDLDNAVTINPEVDTTVTTAKIPGAEVMVKAGTLEDQEGNTFTGQLSITQVPTELTPAALPPNVSPDMVVTIQPGEMEFSTPAPLNLPNLGGFAPGTVMDLWSINPTTGDFDNVGMGIVSDDGTTVETVDGGIRNSSWHFFAPPPLTPPGNNAPPPDCDECQAKVPFKSEVELNTGAVIENYDLVSYSSNRESRSITLTYDSLRADPRPIVQFKYEDVNPRELTPGVSRLRVMAGLTVHGNDFNYQVPGFGGGEYGLDGGEHFWSVPDQIGDIKFSLQADLRDFASGKYDYTLNSGIRFFVNEGIRGSSIDTEDKLLHVNTIDSAFGSGWSIAGWQEIVEHSDGSLLLIDGDGGELFFEVPETEGAAYSNPPGDFSVLEKLPDGRFRRTTKDQMVYEFNANHELASVTDNNGNKTSYIYNSGQRLIKIVDPVGLETLFTYNAAGKVSKITDPANRETLLEYDAAGNLTKITNPDNSLYQWEYDNDHHMVSEIDPLGNRSEAVYDQFGRATQATQEDGAVVKVNPIQTQGLYSSELTSSPFNSPLAFIENEGLTATYADGNGNVMESGLDTSGQRVTSLDGEGQTGHVERNKENLITNQTNARGNLTNYTYDQRGNVLAIAEEVFSNGSVAETNQELLFSDPLYRTARGPRDLATGDLNNDGYLDVITANQNSGEGISVLLGNKNGSFDSRIDYDLYSYPFKIFLEDIDHDGNLDLVNFASSGILVSLGNGDATFNPPINISDTSISLLTDGIVEDINSDGNLDFFAINRAGDFFTYYGKGDGTFSFVDPTSNLLDQYNNEASIYNNNSITSIVFEDLDFDEDLDLVINYNFFSNITANAIYNGTYISTFLNNDSIFTFQDNITFKNSFYSSGKSSVEDLNGDGNLDLVISSGIETSIFLGNGDGNFELENNYQSNSSSSNLVSQSLADFNADGNLDLIESDLREIHIRMGNGDGSFSEPESYRFGYLIKSLIVEDWNNDGYLDFGSVDGRENLSIQYGNGDGTFGVQPPKIVSELSIYNPIFKDLNHDGLLDILSKTEYNSRGDEKILSVALGNGDGTFADKIDTNIGTSFKSFIVDYIDPDENLDLVTVFSGNRNSYEKAATIVSIFPGMGNGTFGAKTDYNLGEFYIPGDSLLAGDIDSDGDLDLVTYHPDGVSILLNNGDGVFTNNVANLDSPYLFSYTFNQESSLHDIDGDGDLDIIDGNSSVNLKIAYNDGTGNFSNETTTILPLEDGYEIGAFNFADLDGDLDFDLVANIIRTQDLTHYIGIWLSNGDGTFQSQVNYQFDTVDANNRRISYQFDLGDVNLDGIIDLIGGRFNSSFGDNARSSEISIALGNGDGTFGRETHYAIPGNTHSIALNDLDNDGDIDVVFGYQIPYYSGSVVPSSGITTKLNQINQSNNNSTLSQTSYTYDPIFNQVTSVTDELGRISLYDIDPNNGNLLSTTRVVGEIGGDDDVTTSYTYTDAGLVDTMTDPLGRVTDYDYDIYGRLIQTTSAQGTEDEVVMRYEYDAAGNQTAIIDANGNRTEFEYDELNRLIKTTYAVGTTDEAVETIEYDEAGNQIATVDGNGNRTEFIYDAKNRLIQTIAPDPDGAGELTSPITINTYDKNGNLIGIIDPLGRETRYVYDSRNRLVETILPDGTVRKSRYDTDNNLTVSVDATGEFTNRIYDARSRLIREVDPLGNVTSYEYDAANQLVGIVDGNGNRTSYEYDELGRQILVRDALGNETRTEYDKAGRVVATIDGNGNRTEYQYDERDRQTKVIDAELGVTTTEYDGLGNVLSITDPVGNITSYQYDARNRLVLETNELGYTRSFEYDDVGNQISLTDRNNRTRSFEYDGLNRQIAENWLDNQGNTIRTTTSEYDAASQLIATFDPDSAYAFDYDMLGRLIEVDNAGTPGVPNVILTYDYDYKGNIISVSDTIDGVAGATTTYDYDELDRVNQITQSGNNVADKRVDFTYDALGQYESMTRYSDLEGHNLVVDSSFTYDEANRLTNLTHSNSSNDVAFYDFTYDAASRITQIIDIDGTNEYTYDDRDQLIGADHSDVNNADEIYSYDANGNRVSSSLHGNGYVTDPNNRLVSDGIYNYAYDNQGNLGSVAKS